MREGNLRLISILLYSFYISCSLGFLSLTCPTAVRKATKRPFTELTRAVPHHSNEFDENDWIQSLGRRNVLSTAAGLVLTASSTATIAHADYSNRKVVADSSRNKHGAKMEKPIKILVLGGTGFVGSQIVKQLKEAGIAYVATSRSGRDGTVALDFASYLDNSASTSKMKDTVKALTQDCTAIISCIGAIGTDQDGPVNAATGLVALLAEQQKAVEHFVYITVAPEVNELLAKTDLFHEYIQGKSYSRETVLNVFQQRVVLIEPTFIYGGGSFERTWIPSRGVISSSSSSASPTSRTIQRLLLSPPSLGMFKMALESPIPVEDVAAVAIAGALGYYRDDSEKTEQQPLILDTYSKIKKAASTAASTTTKA